MSKAALVSQEQANWAYEKIQQWKEQKRGQKKEIAELKSHIRKLPSALQASGLAQTLLFYGKKHEAIAKALAKQLLDKDDVAASVKMLAGIPASAYRAKAREAMMLAQWLKRFAEVMLEDDDDSREG